jgi:hypothetical protein
VRQWKRNDYFEYLEQLEVSVNRQDDLCQELCEQEREFCSGYTLLNFKLVKRFKYRSDTREFRSVGDSTCSRI